MIDFKKFMNRPKSIGWKTVKYDEPVKCRCEGGLVFMHGDAHKSSGMVPCQNQHCRGGWVTHYSKPIYRVKCNSSKI